MLKSQDKALKVLINKLSKKNDLIITSDYSHGFISKNNADLIARSKLFLALNAQLNSSNIGYHTLINYHNVNCVVINENEIRYEMRSKDENLNSLIIKLSKELNIDILVVTQGAEGATLFNKKKNKFIKVPAFTDNVTDKVGAGDSMLSLLSIAIFMKFDF